MEMNEEMITITKEEYEDILYDVRFLQCLHTASVENWEGYDIAIDLFEENE